MLCNVIFSTKPKSAKYKVVFITFSKYQLFKSFLDIYIYFILKYEYTRIFIPNLYTYAYIYIKFMQKNIYSSTIIKNSMSTY